MVSEKEVHALAEVLLGRVNAPEQEIYRASRDGLEAAALAREANAEGGEPCPVCGSIDGGCTEDIPSLRHCPAAHPAPQPSGTVKVKALRWPDKCERGSRVHCTPDSLVSYCIAHYGGDSGHTVYRWAEAYSPWSDALETYEAAKAAAQADYERRILSALTAGKPEQAVPSGWKLVPEEEMTNAMMDAGQGYLEGKSLNGRFTLPGTFNWHEFWSKILSAAPTAGGGE